MKALAILLFSLSSGSHVVPPPRFPVDPTLARQVHKGGRWYFAQNGHAVYCYGPVRVVTQPQGGLQRVATFCQGNKPMVPLKD